jgi:hypothetical protein
LVKRETLKIISAQRGIEPNDSFQHEHDTNHQAHPHLMRVVLEIASNARTRRIY